MYNCTCSNCMLKEREREKEDEKGKGACSKTAASSPCAVGSTFSFFPSRPPSQWQFFLKISFSQSPLLQRARLENLEPAIERASGSGEWWRLVASRVRLRPDSRLACVQCQWSSRARRRPFPSLAVWFAFLCAPFCPPVDYKANCKPASEARQ